MKSKHIYIIRHGETDNNLRNILQGGSVDLDLNETGLRQSMAFYDRYKDVPFAKIYTSGLNRTVQSVQSFINDGIPHEKLTGLNEISYGVKDGTCRNDGTDFYGQLVMDWDSGNLHSKIEGGESPLEVQKRQKEALNLIFSRDSEETILICMHGRAMRILLATIINNDLRCMHLYPHKNLTLYTIDYDSGQFLLQKKNDISHLDLIHSHINC